MTVVCNMIKHRQLNGKNEQSRVWLAHKIYHTSNPFCECVGVCTCNSTPLLKGPDKAESLKYALVLLPKLNLDHHILPPASPPVNWKLLAQTYQASIIDSFNAHPLHSTVNLLPLVTPPTPPLSFLFHGLCLTYPILAFYTPSSPARKQTDLIPILLHLH